LRLSVTRHLMRRKNRQITKNASVGKSGFLSTSTKKEDGFPPVAINSRRGQKERETGGVGGGVTPEHYAQVAHYKKLRICMPLSTCHMDFQKFSRGEKLTFPSHRAACVRACVQVPTRHRNALDLIVWKNHERAKWLRWGATPLLSPPSLPTACTRVRTACTILESVYPACVCNAAHVRDFCRHNVPVPEHILPKGEGRA
jgi:hypothetical protein